MLDPHPVTGTAAIVFDCELSCQRRVRWQRGCAGDARIRWRRRYDGVPQRESRGEDAVIRDQLDDRRRDQSREPFEQRERVEYGIR